MIAPGCGRVPLGEFPRQPPARGYFSSKRLIWLMNSPLLVPPRYEAKSTCDPVEASVATNASTTEPLNVRSNPLAVTGKFEELVLPPSQMLPLPPAR